MGLIKAAKEAIGSTLQDQWKEAIRCDDMNNDILMVKKTTPTGVISNGSTIIVGPGQCAVIYDNGRVLDATAEDGLYHFDTSTTPSFFAGQFKDTFKEMWQRFTYNGASAKEQCVFFFNIKEIMDNKFGTANPIPYQDWSHPIPNRMTNTITPLRVEVRCYGTYTFRISNPALFMERLAGTADVYYKASVIEQIRSEVMAVFQNVLNELGNSQHKVPVLEMPSQTDEIKQMMDEKIYDEKIRDRGLQIECFTVESVTLDEESQKKIDTYEFSSNAFMQQGRMVDAYANAVENAASNANGPAMGFMGIGIANMSSGGFIQNTIQPAFNPQMEQGNSIDMSQNNPFEAQVMQQQPIQEQANEGQQNQNTTGTNPTDENIPVVQPVAEPLSSSQSAPEQPYGQENQTNQIPEQPYSQENQANQIQEQSYGQENQANQIQEQPYGQENQANQIPEQPYGQENQANPIQEQPYSQENQTNPIQEQPYGQENQTNQIQEQPYGQENQANPIQEQPLNTETPIQPNLTPEETKNPETQSTSEGNVQAPLFEQDNLLTPPTPQATTEQQSNENANNQTVQPQEQIATKMCLKCGNMNPANSNFCNNCGNQL